MNAKSTDKAAKNEQRWDFPDRVSLRPLPYPYRALLSICSDPDETPDAATYFEIMRFLNTDEETGMGTGANLEVGNTIYFSMPHGQFAYFNTDEDGVNVLYRRKDGNYGLIIPEVD